MFDEKNRTNILILFRLINAIEMLNKQKTKRFLNDKKMMLANDYNGMLNFINLLQAATNCNISTNIYDKKTTIQDNEEGPEWIKELNKLVTSTEGKFFLLLKSLKFS